MRVIKNLNNDPSIHGFLVQLPLPGNLNEKLVTDAISPEKDVDG
jgi:5,10-methylene-tetrahydrofolate dehydrogenase/methenyl tetrahydrofolate cyclohydrolase